MYEKTFKGGETQRYVRTAVSVGNTDLHGQRSTSTELYHKTVDDHDVVSEGSSVALSEELRDGSGSL